MRDGITTAIGILTGWDCALQQCAAMLGISGPVGTSPMYVYSRLRNDNVEDLGERIRLIGDIDVDLKKLFDDSAAQKNEWLRRNTKGLLENGDIRQLREVARLLRRATSCD